MIDGGVVSTLPLELALEQGARGIIALDLTDPRDVPVGEHGFGPFANFPGFYDKIIVLDGLNVAEEYMTERAKEILELFDWTGLEVEFHPIPLDRFKGLLMDSLSPAAVGRASE